MVMRYADVLVIGGGSAGLAAAVAAREAGCENVLLLERDRDLGGILLQCIHNGFGLHTFREELSGPEYAERYIRKLESLHIPYRTGAMVTDIRPDRTVRYVSPEDGECEVSAGAIVLAMGCRERTRGAIRIPGFRPAGVWTAGAAQRYVNMEGLMVGRRVFILGSGDIGLIMARRMTLEGAQVMGVAEILPYSNGLARNRKQCLDDYGIPLLLSHTVTNIRGKHRLEGIELSEVDLELRPIPGTEKQYDVDTLLLSVGLIPENDLTRDARVDLDPATRGATVDETLETNVPGIFSCGNVLHVHDLVDYVSAEGERAGRAAAAFAAGRRESPETFRVAAGDGVGYVLPQRIHQELAAPNVELMFRVQREFRGAEIGIYKDGSLLRTVRRARMVPAEMEKIAMRREELAGAREIRLAVLSDTAGPSAYTRADPETLSEIPQNDETVPLICIVCPVGCHLRATLNADGKVTSVVGNSCPRGDAYARQEIDAPTRTVTSTVRIRGAAIRRLPVMTSAPVPKASIPDVMRAINGLALAAPIRLGDVVLPDLCGLGVSLVATRSVLEEERQQPQ